MGFKARFISQHMTNCETDGVNQININPFGLKGEKDKRVLITENGKPVRVLQLFIRTDDDGFLVSSAFCELLCNEQYLAIICGDYLHIVDIVTYNVRSQPLNDYVGHLYVVPDIHSDRLHDQFLVATYSYVFLVDLIQGILWKSGRCAIDGVVISAIEDDVIYGQGDWEPPGGWKPFRMALKTGIQI